MKEDTHAPERPQGQFEGLDVGMVAFKTRQLVFGDAEGRQLRHGDRVLLRAEYEVVQIDLPKDDVGNVERVHILTPVVAGEVAFDVTFRRKGVPE